MESYGDGGSDLVRAEDHGESIRWVKPHIGGSHGCLQVPFGKQEPGREIKMRIEEIKSRCDWSGAAFRFRYGEFVVFGRGDARQVWNSAGSACRKPDIERPAPGYNSGN